VTAVRIGERGQRPDGSFTVGVVFELGGEYEVTVSDPGDPGVEQELVWYFEEHLRFPFLDQDRERGAVEQISAYGQALFAQLFGGDAAFDYRQLRHGGFDGCRMDISGSAGFHRLHWETLRDPELNTPLAVRLPVTRRVGNQPSKFALSGERATLNILVVTARPDGPRDVGYRTISRPLLSALRQAEVPVAVDMVRPGTWQALRTHLSAVTQAHGSGWYHVVHFDLHGAFSDYGTLEQQRQARRLLFGSDQLAPFEGKQGFLFFETFEEGQADPVPAGAVASLLAEHRVPMVVLNACQSAMQTASEAGLAQLLVQAGVPAAVGMAYSVTVSAAERVMPLLYGHLSRGVDPLAAMHAMRRELFEHRSRRAYFDQQIELEDWMLPVVFQQQPLTLRLREMTEPEAAVFYQRQAVVGDEPLTEYGFVGRDLDIQAIERRLLIDKDSNQVLVQGMAGAGKSTLLGHVGWWWQRTGLVNEVFRFSYEDRAWTTSQILREISTVLHDTVEQAKIQTLPDAAQLEKIAQKLRARRHLLILDNAESITASPAAIPHALPTRERDRLATLLSRLRGGQTLVVIGSREAETWLAGHSFTDNVYPLPGLDPQATSMLVQRVLRRHHATHHLGDEKERAALQELTDLLGGYPLPLTVVLRVLATVTPSTVLDELKAGGQGADPVGLIRRAIEYSHGKLDPTTQHSLLLLAPFTAVIPTGAALERYRDLLGEHEAVQALGAIDLSAAVSEAISVGLATDHPELPNMVSVQPVLPYFLRSRLHDHPEPLAAVYQTHYQLYSALGAELQEMLTSRKPEQRAAGLVAARAQYANFTTALHHALKTGQLLKNLVLPLYGYLDQTKQHVACAQLLDTTITTYPTPATSHQHDELALLHNLAGNNAFHQHRISDARTHYDIQLGILEALNDQHSQGVTYHQLGIVAQEQRRWEEAEAHYGRALEIYLKFQDRHSAASTYHQLGWVAQVQRRWEEAEAHYGRALEIYLKFQDRHRAAGTYGQLGWVAQAQRRWEEAQAHYQRALEIKLEFQDRDGAARTYHHLGWVAQEQRRWEEAETCYRQALQIKLELEDRHSAARTYHNLGTVAEEQRRWEEAQANYRRALDIFLEFQDRYNAGTSYYQLGMVAQAQRRWQEAETNYRRALDIFSDTNDPRNASLAASRLGSVFAHRDRHTEAVEVLLFAALSWRQVSTTWSAEDLRMLKRERRAIGSTAFAAHVVSNVPADLTDELITAINQTQDT
jgi:tetratricopeptide (TPR) repeat protein